MTVEEGASAIYLFIYLSIYLFIFSNMIEHKTILLNSYMSRTTKLSSTALIAALNS